MNRRKAKKQVKRLLGMKRWPGNLEPRRMLAIHRRVTKKIGEALDAAILYGYQPFIQAMKHPGKPLVDGPLLPRCVLEKLWTSQKPGQ